MTIHHIYAGIKPHRKRPRPIHTKKRKRALVAALLARTTLWAALSIMYNGPRADVDACT
jgi:hypothetical protein